MVFVRASGARQPLPTWLMTSAAAYTAQGLLQEGVALMDETQVALADRVGSVDEADQHRFRGDLLLQTGAAAAEAYFQQAIKIACRRQQAKSWELRATLSLCRLWYSQGRRDEARQRLAAVVGWFTEGFDTPDLRETAELLGDQTKD